MNTRHTTLLILILCLTAVVRIIYLYTIWDSPLLNTPIIDAEYYQQWAHTLASREPHEPGIFFMSPLYPYILSFIYRWFSPHLQVVIILQLLLGLFLVYQIFLLGKRIFSPAIGLLAAFFAALYRPLVFYESTLLSVTFILVLNASALLLLLNPKPKYLKDLGAGFGLGLSSLARPSILLFVLLLGLAWALFPSLKPKKRLVFWVLGVALVLLPVAYRNYRVGGEWVLTTAGLGMNFYTGNNPEAEGVYWEAPFVRSAEPRYENQDYRLEAARRTGKELSLTGASRYWFTQGIHFLGSHPLEFLQLYLKKLFLFFHRTEIPNNLSLYAAQGFSNWLGWVPFTFGWLAPIAFAGWIWGRRKDGLQVLNIYFLSYLLTTLLFFAASEYRLPIMLVVLPFASATLMQVFEQMRQRHWRRLAPYFLVTCLFAIPINMRTDFTDSLTSPRMDYFNLGQVLQKQGFHDQAIPMFQRALVCDPYFTEAHKALGISYSALGLRTEAATEFSRANLDPQRELDLAEAEELFYRAQQKFQEEQYSDALKLYLEGCASHPDPPVHALFNVAFLSLQTGDTAQAFDYLKEAEEADPQEPRIRFMRGLIYENRSDWSAARFQFSEALKINSTFHLARAHAALMELKLGNRGEAAQLIEPLLGKTIPDRELSELVKQIATQVGY